jgi:hypothetical protein
MKNFFLLALPFIVVACSKNNEEVLKLTEQTLAANWRLDAVRAGTESWNQLSYEKNTTSFDLFCVYDAQRNQSFISKSSCSYNNGYSTITVASAGCATSVYSRDTTWEHLTNFDFIFTTAKVFTWLQASKTSKRLLLENETCTSKVYLPEYELTDNAAGTWSFDEAAAMITVTYDAEGSGIDGEPENKFKVTGYTGATLTVKHQAANGAEYRLKKF